MSKSHPRWRMAKRVLTVLFFIAVIVLLVIYAQKVDWQEVWKVIRGYDRLALFSAIALVIVSYLSTAATICLAGPIVGISWRNAR